VKAPAVSSLGWAAEAYSSGALVAAGYKGDCESYLDRYPREDDAKFARRKQVAHYLNYCEAILDILVSYVLKREMVRDGTPPAIIEWQLDVDGQGTRWDDLLDDVVKPRAALLGWTPLLFDQAAVQVGLTRMQTNAQGVRPQAIPLFPANLLDWGLADDGSFAWVKLRIIYYRQPNPLGPRAKEEHYIIWTPADVSVYVVTKQDSGEERVSGPETRAHEFGVVPIAIWRHKPSPEDRVRGMGMVDAVAVLCRRLFNLVSELDEHLRQQVFALLQVPYVGSEPPSEIVAGTDNAVGLPADSKHEYKWIAPPESVAGTYETRIENTIKEIYRIARVEYDRATAAVSSGIAKAYDFEKTNRRLGDFAKQLARAEKQSYVILGRVLGVSQQSIEQATVTAPTDFRVEDLATDIKNAIDAVTIQLTPTAEMWIKKRVIEKMLPNLPSDEEAEIMSELEEQRDAAIELRAHAAEALKQQSEEQDSAPVDGGDDPDKGEDVPEDEAA
jgi:hypothetical protein